MSDTDVTQETPLLAEVEDLTFEEVYKRLTGTLKSKGDLYLGSANAREAAYSAQITSQFEAVARILAGENVFLTGGPGTGKSSIIHLVCKILEKYGFEYEVAAPTGAAAENISGVTLHHLFGIERLKHVDENTGHVSYKFGKTKRLQEIDVLIIDEVSMVYGQLWQEMEEYLQRIRGRQGTPYGGLQIIAVGDFNQLKAVPDTDYNNQPHHSGFAFRTPAWEAANFKYCYLTEAHRATDPELARILLHMSANALTTEDFASLNKRVITPEAVQELDEDTDNEATIRICTRNDEAAEHNTQRTKELPGGSVSFTSTADLLVDETTLTPTHLAQWNSLRNRTKQEVELKIGSKVVADMPTTGHPVKPTNKYGNTTYTNTNRGYNNNASTKISNGSVGYVRAFATTNGEEHEIQNVYTTVNDIPDYVDDLHPIVQFHSGHYIIPNVKDTLARPRQDEEKKKWTSETFAKGSVFPLKPGYAITVHKSQGQTYDGAVIDLGSTFMDGLGYVAISRVRSLDTAYIVGSNEQSWVVDAESVDIMQSIRTWAAEDTKTFRSCIDAYDEAYKAFVISGKKNATALSPTVRRATAQTEKAVEQEDAPKPSADVSNQGSADFAGVEPHESLSKRSVSRDILKRAWAISKRYKPMYPETSDFDSRLKYIAATGDVDAQIVLLVDMLEFHAEVAGLPELDCN